MDTAELQREVQAQAAVVAELEAQRRFGDMSPNAGGEQTFPTGATMKRLAVLSLFLFAGLALATTQTITLSPGDSVTITAAQGGTTPPPAGVTCPDGSQHPAGYVCPTPPPVTGEWNGVCAGYAKTIWMQANWAAPVRMVTQTYGGMSANDIVVYQFTTGSGASPTNNLPRVAGAEYGGGGANRDFNLSETPCTFAPPYLAFASHGQGTPTVPFTVVTPDAFGFYPVLRFNTTYYLNVRAASGSGCTTSCDMFFDLSKNGTP